MVYVPANIYAMYLLKDDPSIWLDGAEAQDQLRERAIERIKSCWRVMEAWRQAQVLAQPSRPAWLLGDTMSLLDVYVCVVSRWTPRRCWFAEACPSLNTIVERIDAQPELQEFWHQRFPLS
jgi:GST-like protein